MATREYTKHSTLNTAPSSPNLGDEWFNPSTNILYKRVAVNGTTVAWQQIPTNTSSAVFVAGSGGVTTMAVVSSLPASPNANTLYIVTG